MSRALLKRPLPEPVPRPSDRDPEADQNIEMKQMHFNYLQLSCLLIGAQYTTVVAGRGTGKTLGVLAPKLHRLLERLHRSSIVLVGATYVQLLTRTGPELLDGMRRLGYVDNQDFWLRRFPDKKFNLRLPHNSPIDPKYSMFFRNPGTDCVSAVRMVGQDRPGSANGLSVSAIIGDEAKLLNKPKLDSEVMAINRGGQEWYGGIAEHHSVTFTTDMPTSKEAKWILNDKTECLKPHHQRAIELILSVQLELYRERQKLHTHVRNAARLKRIDKYEGYLNELRRNLVHYASASSFANVHALTLQYFKEKQRTFSPSAFKAYILNQEQDGVENGFYNNFDALRHCYDATDYRHVDEKSFSRTPMFDCRKDEDLDHTQALTIGMDYGASFNCMVVGQRFSRLHLKNRSGRDEVRYLKSFHVAAPGLVQDVVAQFVEYYQYFYRKEVLYVYDPTAVGKSGLSPMTYADEVIKALKAAGWKVKTKYLTKVPLHHHRYLGWAWCLNEADDRFAAQRFNRENMRVPIQAMKDAKVKEGRNGFEKDKTDEQNDEIDQSTTTHYTDALDTVFWYLTIVDPNKVEVLGTVFGQA
ncbi:hypothetical protein [Spirosoma sordidisoli]|uniref:Terminase n=1 Tax=Spirosoma sordidisoli TaxID=2502893 RepID=A0A4Q2UJT0_9BACT|nr:hypothetical protein [Spirosoma sordidisoli]RYC69757.1 hypothetical protein EQG79_14270 [Spirosoma sordidisoli]